MKLMYFLPFRIISVSRMNKIQRELSDAQEYLSDARSGYNEYDEPLIDLGHMDTSAKCMDRASELLSDLGTEYPPTRYGHYDDEDDCRKWQMQPWWKWCRFWKIFNNREGMFPDWKYPGRKETAVGD